MFQFHPDATLDTRYETVLSTYDQLCNDHPDFFEAINNTDFELSPWTSSATEEERVMADNWEFRIALLPYTISNMLQHRGTIAWHVTNQRCPTGFDLANRWGALLGVRKENQDMVSIIVTGVERGGSLKAIYEAMPIDNKAVVAALTLSAGHYVRVVRRNDRHVVILTNKWSYALSLQVIAVLPILFPHWKNITPAIDTLPQLLIEKKYEEYINILKPWAISQLENLQKNLRIEKLRASLRGIKEHRVSMQQREIDGLNMRLDDLFENLFRVQGDLCTKVATLQGLKDLPDDEYDELVAYIQRKDCVLKAEATDTPGEIAFTVVVPLAYWDINEATTLLASTRGNAFTEYPDVKRALEDLLIKQNARMIINEVFTLNFITGVVRHVGYLSHLFGCGNYHLTGYNCWGNNKIAIAHAIRNKQFIAAFEQAISACGSWNLTDSTVSHGWIERLRNGSDICAKPCIERAPGEQLITFRTYMRRLEKEATPNETTENVVC